jgi:Membrane-bound lysozyme-inhibitor of c-type lysozyme
MEMREMIRSSAHALPALIGAAFALSGFAGGGRVANSPAVIPYVCEGGQTASAIYENGSNFRLAKVQLTVDGRVTQFDAAPTLYGMRYRHAPSASDPRNIIWAVWGERAWLSEATDPYASDREGQRLLSCHRQRGVSAVHNAAAH